MSLVLIVADSVRYEAFGACRTPPRTSSRSPFALATLPATPTVDGLAREGVLFERAVTAAPWTLPSLGSMLTGVYAHRLGLARWDQPWPVDYASLFELARRAGYTVASFVFDPEHLFSRVPEAQVQGSSQDTEPMLKWLREHRQEPFFVLIHYWWTHIPYIDKRMTVPEWRYLTDHVLSALGGGPAARAGVQRLYAHAIERFSESWLPRVLEAIDLDRCWVSVTADHGESWGERTPDQPPLDVFDLHGNGLHDEVLRIPWIVRPPGGTRERRISELVRSIDFMPTFASLLGWWREPVPLALDGRDLAAAVRTGHGVPQLDAISVRNHDCLRNSVRPKTPGELYSALALTRGRWKQVWEPATDRWQAFDLAEDPGETQDRSGLASTELEMGASTLRDELGRAQVGEWGEDHAATLANRLRQWGYVE